MTVEGVRLADQPDRRRTIPWTSPAMTVEGVRLTSRTAVAFAEMTVSLIHVWLENLERARDFEPSTPTLASALAGKVSAFR